MAVKPNGRGWVDACAVHACGHADGFTKRMTDACALTLRLTLLKWAVQQKKVNQFSHSASIWPTFHHHLSLRLSTSCYLIAQSLHPFPLPEQRLSPSFNFILNCVWKGNLLTVCSSKPHISKGLCLPCLVGSPELLAFI